MTTQARRKVHSLNTSAVLVGLACPETPHPRWNTSLPASPQPRAPAVGGAHQGAPNQQTDPQSLHPTAQNNTGLLVSSGGKQEGGANKSAPIDIQLRTVKVHLFYSERTARENLLILQDHVDIVKRS